MTTTNEQRREVGRKGRGATGDDAPRPFGRQTESLGYRTGQWTGLRDDDEFAPTIVRGRE